MTSVPAQDINNEIERFSQTLNRLREEAGKVVVGQRYMIDRLLMALIADGHILIEGLPGLAKTTAVKTLAQTIQAARELRQHRTHQPPIPKASQAAAWSHRVVL